MNESKIIQALASSMIATMLIFISVATICILESLLIPGQTEFVTNTIISYVDDEIIQVSLSALAICLVINVSYNYTLKERENSMTAATIFLCIFLMMMPVFIQGENYFIQAIGSTYIGSEDIFVDMIFYFIAIKGARPLPTLRLEEGDCAPIFVQN